MQMQLQYTREPMWGIATGNGREFVPARLVRKPWWRKLQARDVRDLIEGCPIGVHYVEAIEDYDEYEVEQNPRRRILGDRISGMWFGRLADADGAGDWVGPFRWIEGAQLALGDRTDRVELAT